MRSFTMICLYIPYNGIEEGRGCETHSTDVETYLQPSNATLSLDEFSFFLIGT